MKKRKATIMLPYSFLMVIFAMFGVSYAIRGENDLMWLSWIAFFLVDIARTLTK
jgi:hypothetical protein